MSIMPNWAGWIRTNEMQESKSCALPLGDSPIMAEENLMILLWKSHGDNLSLSFKRLCKLLQLLQMVSGCFYFVISTAIIRSLFACTG